MDTTTGPAVLGPLPAGADMLAGLTDQELDILHSHMAGGWPKQSAVHGQLNDLWWDTEGLLRDCHLTRMALFEAVEYLAPPEPAEVPETEQAAAPPLPDGVAEADPANPYGSYTDPAGKHGRYDAASAAEVAEGTEPGVRWHMRDDTGTVQIDSPAEVAEGVGSGQCSRRNPHTPHGSCQGSAPEFPSEHVEVMPACECTDPDCPDAVHQEPAELRTDDAWEDAR